MPGGAAAVAAVAAAAGEAAAVVAAAVVAVAAGPSDVAAPADGTFPVSDEYNHSGRVLLDPASFISGAVHATSANDEVSGHSLSTTAGARVRGALPQHKNPALQW